MDKGGIKIIAVVILLVFLVGAGLFFFRGQGEWIALKKDAASEISDTTRLTGMPSKSPTSQQVSWENLIPSIRTAIGPIFLGERIEASGTLAVYAEDDLTGDGVSEALIDLGAGGAYTSSLTLMRVEQGKPVVARFKQKDGSIAPLVLLDGTSVRNGEVVKMDSLKQVLYSGSWGTDMGGKVDSCEVVAYRWNAGTKTFDYTVAVSKEIQADFCENLAL